MGKGTTRWIIGTIVVPITVAVFGVFGVQIKDALFPSPPPQIDDRSTSQLEGRVIALEARIATFADLLNVEVKSDAASSARVSATSQVTDAEQLKERIRIQNDSRFTGRRLYVGQRAWDWTVYVDADASVLGEISCVTYELHPTFSEPIQKICKVGDPAKAFSYSATGWGTFNIGVTVTFRDGSEFSTNHYLGFSQAN